MRILLFILSLGIFITLLCSSFTKKEKSWYDGLSVPGIVFVDEEMGIDQTEVTNFHWLEYLYWLGRKYGKESNEYKSQLPDTTAWTEEDSLYQANRDWYLRHSSFRDYPVVGVSYEQVEAYCKWRNDRVFEYYLIKKGEVTWERVSTKDPDSVITIERYKKGEVLGLSSNPKINQYPNYHIPNQSEINKVLHYLEYAKTKKSKRELKNLNYQSKEKEKWPMPVLYAHPKRKPQWIYHFGTNVSEWVAGGKEVFGQNWMNYTTDPTNSYSFENTKAHPSVGFRCAFNWVE